jgi:hypothetical protein
LTSGKLLWIIKDSSMRSCATRKEEAVMSLDVNELRAMYTEAVRRRDEADRWRREQDKAQFREQAEKKAAEIVPTLPEKVRRAASEGRPFLPVIKVPDTLDAEGVPHPEVPLLKWATDNGLKGEVRSHDDGSLIRFHWFVLYGWE